MKDYSGEEFLNKIYQDLHMREEVMHTAKASDRPEEKIAKYMERLDKVTKNAFNEDRKTRENDIKMLKSLYYEHYVIKKEKIPESFFEFQNKIREERGEEKIKYTEEEKEEERSKIIREQKESLDQWIEYLASKDSDMYETWFKYYAFQGMLKLGNYDKEKGNYNRRTEKTIRPFIELNREALAYVYDELKKNLNGEKIEDNELKKLIEGGSFGKLYGYALRKLDEAKREITSDEGIWKKYPQGSNPEILFNDLNGKGTGWCTAGGLDTAREHVNGGDFYVYYTKDKNGKYTQPRIAIRKKNGQIEEIRGIEKDQNLESNMELVVEEKLKEDDFPDRDAYKRK